MPSLSHIAVCHFAPLTNLGSRREQLLAFCKARHLRGHVSLSPEGIELFVAGPPSDAQSLLIELQSWPELGVLEAYRTQTPDQPFERIRVSIQSELSRGEIPGVPPGRRPTMVLPALQLKEWLDRQTPLVILDLRDHAATQEGGFRVARSIGALNYQELPAALHRLSRNLRDQLLVLVCWDGSRSKQAGDWFQHQGFQRTFRLQGGMDAYQFQCGESHLVGRVSQRAPEALAGKDPQPLCLACGLALTKDSLTDPNYVSGKSCPRCFQTEAQAMAASIGNRLNRIRTASNPLPGSVPRDCFKAITIRPSCDGRTVLDALRFAVSHLPDAHWEGECLEGRILNSHHEPVSALHPVRAGQTYLHRFPDAIEPDVNPGVDILHEDDALIVINKPAPLPMHAGGRFFRNTLQHFLNAAYHPEQPRPAHRLDANTTGVLLITRNQLFAGRLQPQFSQGRVRKQYIVRVHGHPPEDVFNCVAAVSSESRELGSRGIALTGGLPARTEFRVLRRDPDATTLLEARPLTGRTNQIRVHLWHLGFPVCGDPVYLPKGGRGHTQTLDTHAPPLNLHSWRLQFAHPLHGRPAEFTAPAPRWAGIFPLAG